MKKQIYMLLLLCILSSASMAQLQEVNATKNKTENTDNFLDLQAKTYGDIFGNTLHIEEFKGIEDFMSLVNKMNTSPNTKTKLIEQYQLYENSLDQKKKELAKIQFNELLLKAIKESQEKDKQHP